MRGFLVGAFALLVAAAASCAEPRSPRCKNVCEREAECAEQLERTEVTFKFDESECVSACAALERDVEGKTYVDKHIECFDKANGCDEIYACNFDF